MHQPSPKSQSASRNLARGYLDAAPTSSVIGVQTSYLQQIKRGSVSAQASYTGATMKSPFPVILTAILLGVLTALQLLGVVATVFAGVFTLNHELPSAPATPQPAFLPVACFVMSVICAALAVWFLLTLIGLVRLKSWARYSVLVIGGLMAGFGAIGIVTSIAMPFLMRSVPNQSAIDPGMMRGVLFVEAAIWGVFTALGVALLIYFTRAATRAIFFQSNPVDLTPPNTSTGRPRPTAVTVISWLYLGTAPFCLVYAFLPFPTFVLGFVFTGLAAHFTYAAIGVLSGSIGYSLLRLHNWARLAIYWWSALCPLQAIILLTPWGARQFRLATDSINALNQHILGMPAASPNPASSPTGAVILTALASVFVGIIVWLLHRHRACFTPLPPPPPLPPATEPEPQAAT